MKRLKQINFLICLITISGCIVDSSKIQVSLKKNHSSTTSASVSSVQIINDQLVISGAGLSNISLVKVTGNSLNQNFTITSQTNSKIIANAVNAFSFDVSKVFSLMISDAEGSATFPIDFSLCNSTLNGKGFNCSAPVGDKDVLSYDAVSGTWKPRPASGLNYLGTFNASSNPATGPAIGASGAYYIISDDGTIGAVPFAVGDWLVSNGSAWQKIDNSTAVLSVFNRTNAIVAQKGDYSLNLLGDVDLPTTPGIGKVLKFDGTNWVAGDDLSGGGAGSVTTASVADGAITDVKLATGISASKISGGLTSSQILDGTIVNADINASAGIDYSKLNIPNTTIPYAKLNIADGSIPYAKLIIADGTIPAAKITGLPSATSILTTTITSGDATHAPDGNAVFQALAQKIGVTGASMTGGGTISNVPDPAFPDDMANRNYVDTTRVAKAGDTITGNLNLNADLGLRGTTNYVTIKAAAATTAYTLTLPANAGTTGQVLTTNGASPATLSWTTPSAAGGGVTEVTGSGPISVTNTTTTPAITIATANTTTTGALSSTDWNTFNNKATSVLANGSIFIGNSSNVATATAVTGDVSITNAGVTTIGADKVLDSHIAANTISPAKLSGTRTIANYLRGDNSWSDLVTDVRNVTLGTVTPTSAVPYSPVSTGDTLADAFNKTQGQLNHLATSAVVKDGTNFLTGTTAVQGITARLTVPTPLIGNLNDATNVQYVSTAISDAMSSAGVWSASSGNVYRSTGYVGIGLNNPAYPLQVLGNSKFDGYIGVNGATPSAGWPLYVSGAGFVSGHFRGDTLQTANQGSASSPAVRYFNEATGLWFPTGAVAVSTAGAERMRVNATGVGIGFTPWNAFGVYRANSDAVTDLISDNTSSTAARYPSTRILNYAGAPAAGAVGNPSISLINSRGTSSTSLPIQSGEPLGSINFSGGTNVNGSYLEGASIWGTATETFSSTASGSNLSFYTVPNTTKIPMVRMLVDQNGYVGINTVSPTTQLQVNGTVKATAFQGDGSALTGVVAAASASGADGLIQYASSAALASNAQFKYVAPGNLFLGTPPSSYSGAASIYMYDSVSARSGIYFRNTTTGNGTNDGANIAEIFNDLEITNYEAGYIGFKTSNTEKMRILANGNVGIGVTTTTYKLEVNGSVAGTTAYATTSDERFKKDITKIPDALEKLTSLDGVYYFFKNEEFPEKNFSDHREMGVIAQKVEKIFPEAVSKDEKGYRSVAYTMLIAPIIESIKEIKSWLIGHDAELANQKRELASVKAQNTKLMEENAAIKSYLCSKDPQAVICK